MDSRHHISFLSHIDGNAADTNPSDSHLSCCTWPIYQTVQPPVPSTHVHTCANHIYQITSNQGRYENTPHCIQGALVSSVTTPISG